MSAFFFFLQKAQRRELVGLWRALMETFYGTFRRCVVHGGYFSTRAKLQRRVQSQISSARAFVYFTFSKGLGDFSGCDASSLSLSMRTI